MQRDNHRQQPWTIDGIAHASANAPMPQSGTRSEMFLDMINLCHQPNPAPNNMLPRGRGLAELAPTFATQDSRKPVPC